MRSCWKISSNQNAIGAILLEPSGRRFLATSRPLPPVNHYKVLGLNSKSTHAEIKASFYNLSKKFHPDVSDQSEEAALKFRQITAAYEVLGNIKLRKMYDKGLLPRDSSIRPDDLDIEYQEPEVKSPYKRNRAQPTTGRTDIFDFDQWSRLHYGVAMNRRSAAKEKWEAQKVSDKELEDDHRSDSFIGFALLGVLLLVGLQAVGTSDNDRPQPNTVKSKKES